MICYNVDVNKGINYWQKQDERTPTSFYLIKTSNMNNYKNKLEKRILFKNDTIN